MQSLFALSKIQPRSKMLSEATCQAELLSSRTDSSITVRHSLGLALALALGLGLGARADSSTSFTTSTAFLHISQR